MLCELAYLTPLSNPTKSGFSFSRYEQKVSTLCQLETKMQHEFSFFWTELDVYRSTTVICPVSYSTVQYSILRTELYVCTSYVVMYCSNVQYCTSGTGSRSEGQTWRMAMIFAKTYCSRSTTVWLITWRLPIGWWISMYYVADGWWLKRNKSHIHDFAHKILYATGDTNIIFFCILSHLSLSLASFIMPPICEYGITTTGSGTFSCPPSPVHHDTCPPSPINNDDDNSWSTGRVMIAKPLFCIGMQHQDWLQSRVAQVSHTVISLALSGKETAESHRVQLMTM
jgi:hypothetical protein